MADAGEVSCRTTQVYSVPSKPVNVRGESDDFGVRNRLTRLSNQELECMSII